MIITITGPGRRKNLFFWVVTSLISLLLINLFLYVTVYNDATKIEGNEISPSKGSGDGVSSDSSKNPVKSIFDTANDFIGSVTGADDVISENNIYKSISDNKRNKRLRSFLPLSYYDNSDFEELKESNKRISEFDRRLLPAFWMHLINKNLNADSESILPANFKLPFNWDLLNNIAVKIQKMKYFDQVVKGKINCAQFRDIAPKDMPESFLTNYCLNYNYEDPNFENDYQLPFLILRKIDQYLSDIEWRKLYGMLYSLSNSPIPENVMFLGGVGNEGRSMLVPLEKVSNGKNNLSGLGKTDLKSYYSKLTDQYIEDQLAKYPSVSREDVLTNGISLYEELIRFNDKLADKTLKVEEDLVYFPSKPMIVGALESTNLKPVELNYEDFKFYLPDEEKKLQKLIETAPEGANTKQLENLDMWAKNVLDPKFEEPWYYGIPSIDLSIAHLDHYDWRFFNVFTLREDPELHTAILHRLSRVWFRICAKFDVPSWMNHGPLIGWYWSGVTLPYDFDLDLQMPIQSLHRISKFLNNTLVYDFTKEEEYVNDDIKIDNKAELGIRSYLIDIDPLYFDRNQVRTVHNDLDARLIDTETGVYIDLTLISDFHSGNRYDLEEQRKYFAKSDYNGYRITVPSHWDEMTDENGRYSKQQREKGNQMKEDYVKKLDVFMKEKDTKDSRLEGSPTKFLEGYLHDKHFHTYKFSELSPLIPTFYENSLSYLPSNWFKNTAIEYQGVKCLTNSYFQKHKFLDRLMLWVNYKDCPKWDEESGNFKEGVSDSQVSKECILDNSKLEEEFKRSNHYTNLHNIYREKLLKGQGDILKFDNFDKDVLPMLQKFDGQLFVPEPFVERSLY